MFDRRITLVYYDPLRSPYDLVIDGEVVSTYNEDEIRDPSLYQIVDATGAEVVAFEIENPDVARAAAVAAGEPPPPPRVDWMIFGGGRYADLRIADPGVVGLARNTGWAEGWPCAVSWMNAADGLLRRDLTFTEFVNRHGEEWSFGMANGLPFQADLARGDTLQPPPEGWMAARFTFLNPPNAEDETQTRVVWGSQTDQGGSEVVTGIGDGEAVVTPTQRRQYTIRYQKGVDQRTVVIDEDDDRWNVKGVREQGRRQFMELDCER